MPFQSLGDFITAADAVGEVRYVEGASLDVEVGCLTELMAERNGPMLVFDRGRADGQLAAHALTRLRPLSRACRPLPGGEANRPALSPSGRGLG